MTVKLALLMLVAVALLFGYRQYRLAQVSDPGSR
jgi:hypothetical protein